MNKRYLIVIVLLLIVIAGCPRSSHILKNGSIEKTKNETTEKLEKIEIKEKKNIIRVEGDNHKGDFIISLGKSE